MITLTSKTHNMDNFMFKYLPRIMFTVIITVFVAVLLGFVFRGYLIYGNMKSGVKTFVVTVPNYDGTVESYMTANYVVKDRCISFKDEFGFNHKICNNFNVTEWTSSISNQ